jgi:hypothetical protein
VVGRPRHNNALSRKRRQPGAKPQAAFNHNALKRDDISRAAVTYSRAGPTYSKPAVSRVVTCETSQNPLSSPLTISFDMSDLEDVA